MDIISSIKSANDTVKDVVPTVRKYFKYQFRPNDYVDQYVAVQKKLERQLEDVDAKIHTQINHPGKKAASQVDNWREEVRKETTVKVEDLTCKGGCFTYICSSRKLDKKTQALNEGICMQGENYTNSDGQNLVIDVHSAEYYKTTFKEMQEQLQLRLIDIEAILKTQRMQPGKIARKEVEDWKEKARHQIAIKVEDLISQGECSSSSDLGKMIEELKQTFERGEKYTYADVSLIIDDHSIDYCAPVFKEKQGRLKHQKELIEANLKTQCEQPRKIARKDVKEWLEKAGQQIAIEVEDLISQGECSSSTNLEKNTEELKKMLEEGKEFTNAGVSLVIDDHSIKGVQRIVEECRGRDDIQDQILEWLKGDGVTRIAVSGMGGVGKTTIMKQVHNRLLKESKFNNVSWVKVSRDFDIIVQQKKKLDILKFQERIARSLGLKLEPEHLENETKLAELISEKLRQGNSVLILDDVWQQFCPEDVGIPNPDGNNGCKLVLTTRLQDLAREMECEVIFVNPLRHEEAEALFLKKVGRAVLSDGRIKRDIEPFFKQILQKCDGVPLAIVTVAKAMRGKLDPRSWKWALTKLSKFEGIFDCLKFSYECLESQYQECFLYCALYPEDYEIPKEELIECWIEEGFIHEEGETRDTMNCEGHVMLEKLVDNCLLESVEGGSGVDCVSMHDLFRDMALDIRPQFLVKAGIALEKLPKVDVWIENLLKVSLMKNHITEIPSSMSPKCPMLTTLLLSNNRISTIPEAFFGRMLGLKILDLSNNPGLSRLPTSISKLEKLTTLLLGYCESLREVPSLSNLVCLKKLDLGYTSIEELPQGLNMLINLKYLCLGGRLSGTLDELLQNLSKLQHLIVPETTKFKCEKIGSWGKLQNLENLVLGNWDDSDAVFGEIGTVAKSTPLLVGTFSSLQFISVFDCHKIKKLFSVRWLEYLQKLQTIEVKYCEQLEEIIGSESEEGEKVTLPKLESLELSALPELKSIYSGSGSLICDSINKIYIWDCKNIESVFWSAFNPLPNLEYLTLFYLENLKCVFDGEGLGLSPLVPLTSFFSLKKVHVYGCNLKKVFSSGWLLRYFQSLKIIEVECCWEMEELIPSSVQEEEKVTLSKLEILRLIQLAQLKRIYNNSSTVLICNSIKWIEIDHCKYIESIFGSGFNQLPNLEYLKLSRLPHLKFVFDEGGLGLSPLVPPTNFVSLKEIIVFECDQLKKVFSSGWLLRYFQSLEIIGVGKCLQLEELISSSAHEEEKVNLPNLQSLNLIDLPTLKSICCGSNVLICDSIQSLRISECKKLKRIPLNFPQTSHPPSLKEIVVFPKEWWESLEWDHRNAKDILLPFCKFQKINWHGW